MHCGIKAITDEKIPNENNFLLALVTFIAVFQFVACTLVLLFPLVLYS